MMVRINIHSELQVWESALNICDIMIKLWIMINDNGESLSNGMIIMRQMVSSNDESIFWLASPFAAAYQPKP